MTRSIYPKNAQNPTNGFGPERWSQEPRDGEDRRPDTSIAEVVEKTGDGERNRSADLRITNGTLIGKLRVCNSRAVRVV